MLGKLKSRKVAALLALAGTVTPIAGLHKFYLGQPLWGVLYLLLAWTPIPRVASAIEGVWYLAQDLEEFDRNFNGAEGNVEVFAATPHSSATSNHVSVIADALRQLDNLRQDGLISEYEFEQKRRQLLNKIV